MSITLGFLKEAVRARSDMTNSLFGDGEAGLTSYIQTSYKRLYDLLVASNQGYTLASFEFSLTGQDGYTIDETLIYKIDGLDFLLGQGQTYTVRSFQWPERNKFTLATVPALFLDDLAPVFYCLKGDRLHFRPYQSSTGNYRCWYIPNLPELVEDEDTIIPSLEKWYNYIVVAASIMLLDSEESDTSALSMELMNLETTIKGFMSNRDSGSPLRVSDTRRRATVPFVWGTRQS